MKSRKIILYTVFILSTSLMAMSAWSDYAKADSFCCFPPGWPGGTCKLTTAEEAILLGPAISGCYTTMATCTSNCAY